MQDANGCLHSYLQASRSCKSVLIPSKCKMKAGKAARMAKTFKERDSTSGSTRCRRAQSHPPNMDSRICNPAGINNDIGIQLTVVSANVNCMRRSASCSGTFMKRCADMYVQQMQLLQHSANKLVAPPSSSSWSDTLHPLLKCIWNLFDKRTCVQHSLKQPHLCRGAGATCGLLAMGRRTAVRMKTKRKCQLGL